MPTRRTTTDAAKTWMAGSEPVQQRPPVQNEMDVNDAIREMPNADRLTNFERGAYAALPRVSNYVQENISDPYKRWAEDRPAAQWLGRQLKWTGSWMGKALNVLDVGAEGAERVSGIISQAIEAQRGGDDEWDNFTEHLADAWYAGALSADTMNLPTFTRDEEGRVNGYSVPNDLPGGAGVVQARKRITELVEQGYERGEALNMARAEYYDDLGALALRAQLYDTYYHIVADPLNLIGGIIPAPLDVLQARRALILDTKVIPANVEILRASANALQDAGKLEDAARVFANIERFENGGEIITTLDKAVLALTGGTIESPSVMGKLAEIPVVGKLAKPFTLTPQSRALETLDSVANHIDTHILQGSSDPTEVMDIIGRAVNGALGPEFGHAFVTTEGRMAQSVLMGAKAEIQNVYDEYVALRRMLGMSDGRNVLEEMARISGRSEAQIVELFSKGDGASFVQLLASKHADEAGEVLARLTDDVVEQIGELSGKPWNDVLFRLNSRNALLDIAGKLTITKFGLKEQGIATKMVAALKAGETLAFLRMNPGFAVRNFINNEFTMIARGLGMPVGDKKIAGLIDEVFGGIVPRRLSDSMSIMSDAVTATGKKLGAGDRIISDFLKGDMTRWDKIANAINGMEFKGIGKYFDMGYWGQKAERSAGRRAFYNGYVQGWDRYFWKPGKGFGRAVDDMGAAGQAALGRQGLRQLEDMISDAMTPQQVQEFVRTGDWNKAASTIVDEANRRAGYDIADMIGDEMMREVRRDLPTMMNKGPKAVRGYFDGMRDRITQEIDDMLESATAARVEYFSNMAQAGPVGLVTGHVDTMDELWGHAHALHAMRMENVATPPASLPDALRNDAWKMINGQSREHFERFWRRATDNVNAFIPGAERAGYKIPSQYTRSFDEIKNGWGGFFDLRDKLHGEYFALPAKDRVPGRWNEIQLQLDNEYERLVQIEQRAAETLDNLVYDTFVQNNPELADVFASWRAGSRELRLEDKLEVMEFRKSVRGTRPEERTAAFQQHWRKRQERWAAMTENYRAGIAALQGNTTAQQAVIAAAPGAGQYAQKISLANRYKLPTISEGGAKLDNRIVNTVNKYLRNEYNPQSIMTWNELPDIEKLSLIQDAHIGNITNSPRIMDDATELMLVRDGKKPLAVYGGGGFGSVPESIPNGVTARKFGDITYVVRDSDIARLPQFSRDIEDILEIEDYATRARALSEYLGYSKEEIDSFFEVQRLIDSGAGVYDSVDDVPQFILDAAKKEFEAMNASPAPRQFTSLDEIDLATLEQALEARRIFRNEPLPKPSSPFKGTADSIEVTLDIKDVMKDEMYPWMDVSKDQMFQHGWESIDHLESTALDVRKRPPLKFEGLDDAAKADIEKYLASVEGQMRDAKNAAIRFGEYRRDSALLNYNRRYQYNAFLDNLAPFSFWMTQSVQKWALESINRPHMLAYYLRIKKFMQTAGAPGEGFPSRLSNSFRIKVPFMPDWMGDSIYIDPLSVALPISQWASPFEQWHSQQFKLDGRAEYVLEKWIEQGKYDAAQIQQAIETHEGQLWELAISTASSEMEQGDGVLDYASLLISPHAPLQWGMKILQGRQEDIGPITPLGRTMRIASAFLGVNKGDPSKGIVGNVRQHLGLPAFDKWDDYRTERMLSNMVARNEITLDDAMRAMIDHSLPTWDLAAEKAHIEFAGGSAVNAALKIAGVPLQTFPEGEQLQRSLQDDFNAAMEARDNGDVTALTKFFDEHPEYEARLALFKEPEERMQRFLVDNLWQQWNEMPKVHQNQVRDALGEEFNRNFLDKNTRNTDEIPTETLQIWLKTMGGDPPGTMSQQAIPIDFAPQDTTWVAQQFYDIRNEAFPDYYTQQTEYFALDDSEKSQYLRENPALRKYWGWRNEYFHRNPTILPYVDDDYELKYSSAREEKQAYARPMNLTYTEWQYVLGSSAASVISSGTIPDGTEEYLEDIAMQMGMSIDELVANIMQSR